MLVHANGQKFDHKATDAEIGGIKTWFTQPRSIKDLTIRQIAKCLVDGRTIQPGVTPFSENSRAKGRTGTVNDDFKCQTLFMNDIDNKREDMPLETPEHVAEVLAGYNLKVAFMYETFSSTPEHIRFRFALVSDTEFTDKEERDRLQAALMAAFPQADQGCGDAVRLFLGTNKGLIEGYTDFDAVCAKADLLAFADAFKPVTDPDKEQKKKNEWTKFGETIPAGQRHGTLVSFAATVLKKFGVCEQAYDAFMERVAQCEEPKPDEEIEKIWRDACAYYESTIAADPEYLQPEEYAVRDFTDSLMPSDYTDVGQAKLFAAEYGQMIKYTPATKFIVNNGYVWQESETKAQRLSQELTERQLVEARERVKKAQIAYNKAVESGDEDKVEQAKQDMKNEEKFRSYVLGRRKSDKVRATLTEARPLIEIDVAQLDADGYLLNTPDGTVDLRTGEMKPHNPEDFCTKITSVAPDTENADLFAAFMDRVTVSDKALEWYLQEIAGMCAVGHVLRENMIIAYGEGGNGKSTLFNLLAHVLGDYAGALSAETLTANCRKNKSPEYAELRGKRLVIAAELEEGMRLDTSIVKNLCSTDPILAEKKYKDPLLFVPSHTVILYTNHLPKIGTIDKGTWDRIIAVPFNANFRGMQGEIKNYADYLYRQCGGAVLTWIIEGARRFIANDYNIEQPECVRQAIEQYRENNDWLDAFLGECCETNRTYTQKSGELYARYKSYCDGIGDYRRSFADFKQALTAAGFETRKTKTGAVVHGLRMLTDFDNELFSA